MFEVVRIVIVALYGKLGVFKVVDIKEGIRDLEVVLGKGNSMGIIKNSI